MSRATLSPLIGRWIAVCCDLQRNYGIDFLNHSEMELDGTVAVRHTSGTICLRRDITLPLVNYTPVKWDFTGKVRGIWRVSAGGAASRQDACSINSVGTWFHTVKVAYGFGTRGFDVFWSRWGQSDTKERLITV